MKTCRLLQMCSLLLLGLMCGCSNSDGEQPPKINNNVGSRILFNKPTKYLSLLDKNHPTAITYSVNDYTNDTILENLELKKNWGKTKLMLDPDNKYSIEFRDSCNSSKEGFEILHSKKIINNINECDTCGQGTGGTEGWLEDPIINVTVQTVDPIYILSPDLSNECNKIPYCWHEDMEISWNADNDNENGIIIVAAWTGVILGSQTSTFSQCVYNIDLVEDDGHTVLNNDLFDSMPDRAVVTLVLFRANIVTFTINNIEELLIDPTNFETEDIYWIIQENLSSTHPEQFMQAYNIARGSAALFSFVLVRDRSI